jgi:predicted lipoprotein with Yx(FWY)xxD motif
VNGQISGMRECAGVRAELGVYVLGAITPADRARVVRHLASCRRCREEVAGIAALPALLRRVRAETAAQLTVESTGSGEPGAASALQDRVIRQVTRRRHRQRWLTTLAIAVLAAAASSGWALRLTPSGPGPPVPATILESARADGVTLLTSTEGFTVYWFTRDTATTSACTGSCAVYWPPVAGPAAAGPGVAGRLGTITRPDGTTQATYDGHPLYTATADTAPGQARVNNLDVSGGTWHEIILPGPSPHSGFAAACMSPRADQEMPKPLRMVCASTVSERTATAATLMVATILKARPFAASPRTLARLARTRT